MGKYHFSHSSADTICHILPWPQRHKVGQSVITYPDSYSTMLTNWVALASWRELQLSFQVHESDAGIRWFLWKGEKINVIELHWTKY